MSKAQYTLSMDMTELNRMIQKVDSIPRSIAAHLRKKAIPEAVQRLNRAWYALVPVGDPEDKAKQSQRHKQKWGSTPDVKDSINHNIRHWNRTDSSLWVGPELTNRGGTSPGNKLFFDYMGKRDRMMSFWSDESGGSKRYRARKKRKRWISKIINDQQTPGIVRMMMTEVQRGFAGAMKK